MLEEQRILDSNLHEFRALARTRIQTAFQSFIQSSQYGDLWEANIRLIHTSIIQSIVYNTVLSSAAPGIPSL